MMKDYKELVASLREEAEELQAVERDIPTIKIFLPCTRNHIAEAADVIEQQKAAIERLEAETRAKEQYIADAISKVIRERDAEVSGMCKFRITGFESSESWERYQYSSDAPVDVTVFAKSKKEAIEKAEKIIGCPISTTNRYLVVQEVEHEAD